MKNFTLKLISPDGVKYEEEASSVVLPTDRGQIEILPNHMPLISLLKPGEIIVKNGNREHDLSTEGGVVQIENNLVTVLADTADDASSLDELKIIEAKKSAEHRLTQAVDDVEFADAEALLEKQLAKLSFLAKRKKKYQK